MSNKTIAILAANDYEERELWTPLYRLREAGARVDVLGIGDSQYHSKHGLAVDVDKQVAEVHPDDYDGVVIPGGYAPDKMRSHTPLLEFVRILHEQDKVVAWICHAGWVAVSAGIVSGKRVTSYHTIRDDMVNAGATWVDEAVVRDGNLISSRMPGDIPVFNRELIAALGL